MVQGLEPLLTTANYDTVVQLVVDAVVMRLEALVLQKRFNQLGGLQLEREMRQVTCAPSTNLPCPTAQGQETHFRCLRRVYLHEYRTRGA